MNIVSQLNTYVQKMRKTDPLYVVKRDGDVDPPSYVGTLSAPGFSSVSVYPGSGLPNKLTLRRHLATQFVLLNNINLTSPALNMDQTVAVVPTSCFSSEVSTTLSDLIVSILKKTSQMTFAAIRTDVLRVEDHSFDETLFALLALEKQTLVRFNYAESKLLWYLPPSPLCKAALASKILNTVQLLDGIALPLQYQHRDKAAPLSSPVCFTSSVIIYPWCYISDFSNAYGSLRHYSARWQSVMLHRFLYNMSPNTVFQSKCLYVTSQTLDYDQQPLVIEDHIDKLVEDIKPAVLHQRQQDELRIRNFLSQS